MNVLVWAAAEPSKVPFYIAGLLLAGWAVGVSAVGITRPGFLVDVRGQRAVILISVLLVAFAVAMALVTDK
jgi:hypothetical protein